jgi:uncharacterized protein YcfL
MKKQLLLLLSALVLSSCTSNQKSRNFGGTETIKLEPQEKFINITWKQDNLWIIVQDTVKNIYYAREKSSYGILEGKVIIQH